MKNLEFIHDKMFVHKVKEMDQSLQKADRILIMKNCQYYDPIVHIHTNDFPINKQAQFH